MSNPFIGGHRFMTRQDVRDIVSSSYSREQELKHKCKEAHDFYVDLSKGKDDVGRMEAMERASYRYGLNYRSIYEGRPIADL